MPGYFYVHSTSSHHESRVLGLAAEGDRSISRNTVLCFNVRRRAEFRLNYLVTYFTYLLTRNTVLCFNVRRRAEFRLNYLVTYFTYLLTRNTVLFVLNFLDRASRNYSW